MPVKRNNWPKNFAITTFTEAAILQANWLELFDGKNHPFYADLRNFNITSNSTIDTCSMVTLAAVGALSGHAKVNAGGGHVLNTNLYSLIVSSPGHGKTPGFRDLFLNPLKPITSLLKEANKVFHIQDGTKSGILKKIQQNSECILAIDEFIHTFEKLVSSKSDSVDDMRGIINTLWNALTYVKAFATQEDTTIDDCVFSIHGLTQPKVYMSYIHRQIDVGDGLHQRFLTACVPLQIEYDESECPGIPCTTGDPERKETFLAHLAATYLKIYEYHHQTDNEQPCYVFSREAQTYVNAIREEQRANMLAENEALVLFVKENPNSSFSEQAPVLSEDTFAKDYDHGIKLAAIIHILGHFYLDASREDIPLEIPISTVTRAFECVAQLRKQQNVIQSNLDKVDQGPSSSSQPRAAASDPPNELEIQQSILTAPGPYVSTRMLIRLRRNYRANHVSAAMRGLSRCPTDDLYCGRMINVRGSWVFYKCPPDSVKRDALDRVGCRYLDYHTAYSKDTSTLELWEDASKVLFKGNYASHISEIARVVPSQLSTTTETTQSADSANSSE